MQLHKFGDVISMRRLLLLPMFLVFFYGALSPAEAKDRILMADAGNAKNRDNPVAYMRKKYPGCEKELLQLCLRSSGASLPKFCQGKHLNLKDFKNKDVDSICAK